MQAFEMLSSFIFILISFYQTHEMAYEPFRKADKIINNIPLRREL